MATNAKILKSDLSTLSRITNLENNVYKITYYKIVSGTSGTITPPTGATFNANEFGDSGDSILSKINVDNKPTFSSPLTAGSVVVTANLNPLTGGWTTSGTYTDTNVALIYSINISAINLSNLNNFYIIEETKLENIGGGGGVPYTGAVSDVNLGEFGIQLGNLEFDNTPTTVPTTAGSVYYNDTDGTLDLILKGGNVTLQVGQEQVVRVVNKTATNISLLEANYQAVRITGAQGQRPKVDLAQATTDPLSSETIGLVTETIANNAEGFITTSGLVRGINTTGSLQGETWADGDILYLSPTTAGNVTKVKPTAPNHLIVIGYVIHAHATQGTIYVKVDNGYELDELHNVKIATPANNNVLAYTLATDIWENKTVESALGFTPVVANSAITGATKTKITYDAKGLVTAGADATTADIAASTNKNYVTDAQATVIGNTSGTNSGNQTLANTSDATSHTVTLSSTGGSVQLVEGSGITLTTTGTSADGIITIASTGGGSGTVTNVSALTLGTTGTDLSSTVANSTTTPVITLNVPNASAANRGALTSTDWSTFNDKQATLVSGTSIKTVNSTSLLGSGDVAVQATLVSGTNIKTINSTSILGSGNLVVAASPSGVAGAVQFSDGTALSSDATKFFWDNTNKRLGIGTNAPQYPLHVSSGTTFTEVDIEATGASARAFFRTQVNAADTYFDIRAHGTTSASSTYAGVNMQGGNVLLSSPRDAGLMIINNSAKPIMFAVSATEVMRLDTNYYMGIGINAPTSKLHVKGSGTTSGTSSLNVTDSSAVSLLLIKDDGAISVSSTNTASGTTGNRTINKASGTVNIAAAGTTVTVTNSLVTAASIVMAVLRTNDSTAIIKNVVPSAASFVINLSAAATAEVSIGFLVIN